MRSLMRSVGTAMAVLGMVGLLAAGPAAACDKESKSDAKPPAADGK